MKAAVICPDPSPPVRLLSGRMPLALVPCLGGSLLERELARLADRGARDIRILTADRPDLIRRAVGRGERWGVSLTVSVEPRECTVEETRHRLRTGTDGDWLPEPDDVVLLGRSADPPEPTLFSGGEQFHAALIQRMAEAGTHRVGARELSPGVWTGLRSRVDPGARLHGPCWIGERTWIRARAEVGPSVVVEDGAIVDEDAEIRDSWIGPRTYVGAMTHVNRSLAWGNRLYDWKRDSLTRVADAFLLGDLERRSGERYSSPLPGRLAAMLAACLSSPVVLLAALRNRSRGEPLFLRRSAVAPSEAGCTVPQREVGYCELNGLPGLWRRWPQLWSIARGDFAWVGNRPLTRAEATQLETEFEQLWLTVPIGLVGLADTHGCSDPADLETRAHSSFYAARREARLNRQILRWFLRQLFRKSSNPGTSPEPS